MAKGQIEKSLSEKLDKNVTMADVANSIRDSSPTITAYTNEAISEDIREFAKGLEDYIPARNEFIENLVTRIVQTVVIAKNFRNPLAEYKRGQMPVGYTIQEVYADLVKEQKFDAEDAAETVFKRVKPDVRAYYYSRDRQAQYPITISEDQLRSAFTSWGSLSSLTDSIINQVVNSNQIDEFNYMKQLMDDAITDGRIKIVKVEKPIDTQTSNDMIQKIKEISNMMVFPSREYNASGVAQWTNKEDQRMMMSAKTDAVVDVQSLASAFNMDKLAFAGKRVMIDKLPNHPNVAGVVFDKDFYVVYDQLQRMTQQYNGKGLYYNFFYNAWQVLAVSMFRNACAFMYDDGTNTVPDVTGVVISPEGVTLKVGSSQQFTGEARVTDDSLSTAVKFTVSGQSSETTTMTENGLLTIGADESNASVTVTATAVADTKVSRSTEVQITK